MRCAVTLLAVGLCGCSSVSVVRNGSPVALASGKPSGACERADWLHLVPAVALAEQTDTYTTGWGRTQFVSTIGMAREERGLAVYRGDSGSPEDLNDLLPRLNAASVADLHLQLTRSIESRWTASDALVWSGSILFTGAGIGGALLWLRQDSSDGVEPLTGVVLGAAGAGAVMWLVGALLKPSLSERTYVAVRRHLLIPQEDDDAAVRMALDSENVATRASCGSR